MAFTVFEKPRHVGARYDLAAENRRRRKPRPPAGDCPVCGVALPDKPPSQRRRYCSRACLGIAKRGVPLGPRQRA